MQSTRLMMPSKKKKYNARFPAGRIKKIMQTDEDVGKIAHGVPVVISRSVELFVQSLLQQTASITRERNAKTLSLAHFKHCILRESKFDFLKDLVRNIEDVSPEEERKSSKSSLVSFACSSAGSIPANECRQEGRRKAKSEADSEDPSSSTRNDRPRKRRCSALTNNSANETSNLNLQLNIDHTDYYSATETQSGHRNSCDLVIDEDCDT